MLTATGSALASNSLTTIYDVAANVPSAATYGASDLLQITGLTLNGVAITGIADRAIHKVAYLGDAEGTRIYTAADASLITRVAAAADTGFDAYPLTDPVIIADVAGRGVVLAADASLVSQAAAGLTVPGIPALPADNRPVRPNPGADPVVKVATVAAAAGENVDVPVTIAGPAGVDSFDLAFTYDAAQLSLTPSDVRLAGLTASGWGLAVNVDAQDGVVLVSGYGSQPLPGGEGKILDLLFGVAAAGPAETIPIGVFGLPGSGLNAGAMPLTPIGGAIQIGPAGGSTSRSVAAHDAALALSAAALSRDQALIAEWLSAQQPEHKKISTAGAAKSIDLLLSQGAL